MPPSKLSQLAKLTKAEHCIDTAFQFVYQTWDENQNTLFPLSWSQNNPGLFQHFPCTRSIFPGPCRESAMFKYGNKQQLRSLGERCKLCQRVPGKNPGRKSIFGIPAAQKTYMMATIMAIFNCINMSIWYQKLSCTSLPSKFQDFPGPCK